MKILVINGPNINMVGIREPAIYGSENYETLCARIDAAGKTYGVDIERYQSNYEGDIVTKIQQAYGVFDGIVILFSFDVIICQNQVEVVSHVFWHLVIFGSSYYQ